MRLSLLSLLLLSLIAAPISSADDNPADYTAALIPLVSHGLPGAHGSVWDSELHIFNASDQHLRLLGAMEDIQVLPVDLSIGVGPRETRGVVLSPREPGVDGAFLYVPNTHLGAAKMSLRVRDTSQNATSLGDDVPVVRAEQAAQTLTIFNVPIDPKYRATLRIYGFTPAPMPVRVTVYSEDLDTPLSDSVVALHGVLTTVYVPFPPHPAYAAFDPLTDIVRHGADRSRVRIEISSFVSVITPPPTPIWAFVSLTNNETNQVTIVTPK